jgi:predicted molibdopterin-dependent oxidoreductase YjgC
MDYRLVPSVCPYCGTGCGILYKVLNGRITGVLPLKSHPVNEGKLCIKGWNAHAYVHHPLRLKAPLLKTEGRFHKVSWDRAIRTTADRLGDIREKHGPDAIGVLVSAKITNEENFLAQKFARTALGTNNIDHCARL